MRIRTLALLASLTLGACGGDEPAPPPDPAPTTEVPEPELEVPRGLNLHVTSELVYASLPDVPHELVATYQGLEHGRWVISRVADEDGDRQIEYRAGDRAFRLPQDRTVSEEYLGAERDAVLRRMELRRIALGLGLDEPPWDDEGALELGGGLGRIERGDLEQGGQVLTLRTPTGAEEESLRILGWQQHGLGTRPTRLELWFGGAHIWTETVTDFSVDGWFKPRYFWPPDRADEAESGY